MVAISVIEIHSLLAPKCKIMLSFAVPRKTSSTNEEA